MNNLLYIFYISTVELAIIFYTVNYIRKTIQEKILKTKKRMTNEELRKEINYLPKIFIELIIRIYSVEIVLILVTLLLSFIPIINIILAFDDMCDVLGLDIYERKD